MDKLSAKQKAFCREFIVDYNASQAAIRAGYSEKGAGVQGHHLLKNPNIQANIKELVDAANARNDITVDRVLSELASIAFVDPAELFNDDGSLKPLSSIPEQARRAIAGIEVKTVVDGRGESAERSEIVKLKTWDKGSNLERLGKYLKMFSDGKTIELPENSSFTMVVHGVKE